MQITLVFWLRNVLNQLHMNNVSKAQVHHMEEELIGATHLPLSDRPQADL